MNKSIALDLSSGDKGSTEAIKAAVDFCVKYKDWKIVGFLKEEIEIPNKPENLEIIKCTEIVEMTDGPLQVRRKTDSTLVKSIEYVLEGNAGGVVSPASSGPLVAAGYLLMKPIEGTKPAFAPIFKDINGKPVISLDIGANIDVDAETLNQYAVLGSVYAKALGIADSPIVKQLNIGEEDKKGRQMNLEAFKLMSDNNDIIFKGNIEASEILLASDFDVLVTDAFSGNIALKSIEGTLLAMKELLKRSAKERFSAKLGLGVFAKNYINNFRGFARGLSGGACVLGLNELLIKTHGGSDSVEFTNSLETAKILIENELIKSIKEKF